jgi:hypothetical protein
MMILVDAVSALVLLAAAPVQVESASQFDLVCEDSKHPESKYAYSIDLQSNLLQRRYSTIKGETRSIPEVTPDKIVVETGKYFRWYINRITGELVDTDHVIALCKKAAYTPITKPKF